MVTEFQKPDSQLQVALLSITAGGTGKFLMYLRSDHLHGLCDAVLSIARVNTHRSINRLIC
jgi:hypothetical protein